MATYGQILQNTGSRTQRFEIILITVKNLYSIGLFRWLYFLNILSTLFWDTCGSFSAPSPPPSYPNYSLYSLYLKIIDHKSCSLLKSDSFRYAVLSTIMTAHASVAMCFYWHLQGRKEFFLHCCKTTQIPLWWPLRYKILWLFFKVDASGSRRPGLGYRLENRAFESR